MSRSLGDSIAKSIGVISKPISYHLPLCKARDQFIILGTDGIWDAMDNTEATNFIEKFRDKCLCSDGKQKKVVSVSNSNIAEFLCEEARFRWFEICSEEDVAIDDISAIVLEIKFKEGNSEKILRRKGITIDQSLDIVNQTSNPIIITERFDIKRGSNAVIEEDSDEEIED